MKIAMVSDHASPLAALGGVDVGGQNVRVAELSAAMARRGHDVTVYTRRDDPDLPERVSTPQGYTVVHVPAGPARRLPEDELLVHTGPFAQHLDQQWSADRPDVAHAHFWMSGIATQLAARHLDLPAVQTFHALGVVERRHQGAHDTSPEDRLKLEAMVARTATWVAATCTDEVFELMRLGRSRSRISVVPCGVDLDLFTPDGPRAERGARHRIVSVGRLLPRKGFDVVVRALTAIPEAELILVGGPERSEVEADPEARRLRELAERLGVGDRVVFQGAVARADMPALLRSADVVACTPWYEPFGIVPLEAMASGVPVVAAAVGAMLDTVVQDVTGRLVAARRPGEVADAINTLLHDEFLGQSLGAAGRDRARARYSWDRIAADTLRIYERLVPAASRPRAARTSVSSV
ncbi:glycosyltransferase [Mycolicibacterium monacense]|uniref:Glycosyl transferase n=1 Tax=Mycolicibacterium monacense TaxID=85693 RepID=A0AAD1MY14_MYCMB|nr:glycosyltransferase [Mycolicibacterium monacense]MDA4104120.1 glycosyl transferase [Mycolicibacterium monacense DSM 44395]ORB23340.1 glycosyl transferase [Mycolicibacterium monacense DSM 44395]QHP85102.1 glycosyltransferase family 1 protein [Mycolicibacterium monacense DSM 44395]BBZ62063.1 glycosyl transferase [Mycolicibacterium monacense]